MLKIFGEWFFPAFVSFVGEMSDLAFMTFFLMVFSALFFASVSLGVKMGVRSQESAEKKRRLME